MFAALDFNIIIAENILLGVRQYAVHVGYKNRAALMQHGNLGNSCQYRLQQ